VRTFAYADTFSLETGARFGKTDAKIDQVETGLNGRIDQVEIRLNGRIDLVESRLETKIAESRAELVRWVVGVGILQSSLIAALLLKMMH
jgi:hydroxyethylthiazole kinase-like sugar kinase family protein